jgi:hypothetical protein
MTKDKEEIIKHWIGVDKPKIQVWPLFNLPPRNWYDSDNDPQSPINQDLE